MGAKLITGDLAVDDRGVVRFVNDFGFQDVKRFYVVENHRVGFVRAWHAHKQEGKYAMMVQGTAIVAITKIEDWETPTAGPISRFVLSADKPAILWIPPGYANGFKTLTLNARIMFFSTATLEESKGDDFRWNPNAFGDAWTIIER